MITSLIFTMTLLFTNSSLLWFICIMFTILMSWWGNSSTFAPSVFGSYVGWCCRERRVPPGEWAHHKERRCFNPRSSGDWNPNNLVAVGKWELIHRSFTGWFTCKMAPFSNKKEISNLEKLSFSGSIRQKTFWGCRIFGEGICCVFVFPWFVENGIFGHKPNWHFQREKVDWIFVDEVLARNGTRGHF